MASGSGRSLGAALVDLFTTRGRPGGQRARYDRKTWQGQFSQMSKSPAGYKAMEAAGLSATTRTQRAWLSGDATATPENQAKIAQAYASLIGGWSPSWETAEFKISGRVTQGNDSRVRGFGKNSPLRLEGSLGDWDAIEEAWADGADPAELEALFIEGVVIPNLGVGSYPWEFDGDWYRVEA